MRLDDEGEGTLLDDSRIDTDRFVPAAVANCRRTRNSLSVPDRELSCGRPRPTFSKLALRSSKAKGRCGWIRSHKRVYV